MNNMQDGPRGARKDSKKPRSWFARRANQVTEAVAVVSVVALFTLYAIAPEDRGAAAANEISVSEGHALILESAENELRSERLADGSIVSLSPGTRMQLYLREPQWRRIVMNRGEARFTVAKDPTRPFTVETGRVRATAVGTSFTVKVGACGRTIHVHEGEVQVQYLGFVRSLKAGQRLNVSQNC